MAEKCPNQGLPDQITESIDQSEPVEDQHGLVVGQTKLIGDQHGKVADHSEAVAEQLQTLEHKVSALQLAQTTGAQTVYNIETQYNVSGGQTIQKIDNSGQTHASTSDMKRSVAVFDLHECQEELREYYLEDTGKVNMLPWIPEENIEMGSIFVDIDLVRKEKSKASRSIESNEHLVALKTNQGQNINRVLLTGDAGSGKSTTASNLAYKWALNDKQSLLYKFSLVFLIRMKDIEDSNSSLVDLIFENILSEDSNVSKEGLTVYIKENAKNILFIVDGMDEDSSGALKNKSSGITKLLHNRELRKSCVVLTSRPGNISDLGKYLRHYTQVQLTGFSFENVVMYIVKFFQDDEENIALLSTQLISEPHILALATIPVLLLMMCMLWEDQRTIPKTKTQLYQKTIRYLWRRYKTRMDGDSDLDKGSDNHEFDDKLEDLLKKLGEVALNNTSINGSKLKLKENELGDVCDLGCQVGLLKRERSRAGIEKRTSVTFLHATLHYFCAAFYLVYLLDTGKKTLDDFDGVLFSFTEQALIKYVPYAIEFCCAMQPKVTTAFLQIRTDHVAKMAPEINDPFDLDISIHLRHIFDSQLSYQQCSNLIPLFSSYDPKIDVTDDLIPSIRYMLELYKNSVQLTSTGFLSSIKTLTVKTECYPWLPTLLKHTNNIIDWLPILLKHTNNIIDCAVSFGVYEIQKDLDIIYRALSVLPHLKGLQLHNVGMRAPIFQTLDATNLLKLLAEKRVKLTLFRLYGFQFDEMVLVRYLSGTRSSMLRLELHGKTDAKGQLSTINNVIEQLPRLTHLNHLEICVFQIRGTIKHLRPIISQLQVLGLMKCDLREKHLKELFSFLSRAQQLIKIYLCHNLISVTSIQTLVGSLKTIHTLEELYLEDTCLNDESACILARFIKEKSSMNALYLEHNPGIGHKGKDALIGLPQKCQVLGLFGV